MLCARLEIFMVVEIYGFLRAKLQKKLHIHKKKCKNLHICNFCSNFAAKYRAECNLGNW